MCPIFEYQCDECGSEKEELRSVSLRDKVDPCPLCRNGEMKRQVSKSNFRLLGGGWAKHGYADSSKSPNGGAWD